MHRGRLATHEILDLHELIGMKNICAAKSSTLMHMVSDQGLRNLLAESVQASGSHAQQIQRLLGSTTQHGTSTTGGGF